MIKVEENKIIEIEEIKVVEEKLVLKKLLEILKEFMVMILLVGI